MTAEQGELHVHLGVDGVFENLFERLFTERAFNKGGTDISYLKAEAYRRELRDVVDGASIPIFTFPEEAFSRKLLISRPRMLFPGTPLNCGTEVRKLVYKLDNIQQIFSGRRIQFHLLLTDHISYFYGHQKYVSLNSQLVLSATWQPLITAVSSRLLDGNSLQIWNAEELEQFLPLFFNDALRIANADMRAVSTYAKSIEAERPSSAELAEFGNKYGLNQEFFDHAYEDELRSFRQLVD